jgi:hypothetical protein
MAQGWLWVHRQQLIQGAQFRIQALPAALQRF